MEFLLCCGILSDMDPLETTTTKKSQRKTETEHIKGAHTQVLAQ